MRSRDIKNQIKSLQGIGVSPEWKASQRDLLLSQIRGQMPEGYSSGQKAKNNAAFSWEVFRFVTPAFVFRPVGAIAIALLLVVGGSAASVSAGKSLPGDMLYPVKIATERAQLTFTRSSETKAHLQIEFAQRRIEELQKIAIDPQRADRQIEKTVLRAQRSFENAQEALAVLGENDIGQEEMVLIAKVIEEKSDELGDAVVSLQEGMEDSSQVAALLDQIEETSVAALSTMVEGQDEKADGELSGSIAVLVGERMAALGEKVSKLEEVVLSHSAVQEPEAAALAQEAEEGEEEAVEAAASEAEEGEPAEGEFVPSGIEPEEEGGPQKAPAIDSLRLSVEEVRTLLTEAASHLEEGESEEALALLAKGSQIVLDAERQAEALPAVSAGAAPSEEGEEEEDSIDN